MGEKKRYSLYRKTDAFESWTWPGYEGKKTTAEIYSIGTKVELFQNGKSLGRKPLKDYAAFFPVVYQPGILEAVSFDEKDQELGRSTLRSADKSRKLTVTTDKTVLAAGGEDLAYLDIALTDENGIVHAEDETAICIAVEGSGTLQGFGTGNPKPKEPYDGNVCQSYQGRAQAVIRSAHEEGYIHITISAEGYKDTTITLLARCAGPD